MVMYEVVPIVQKWECRDHQAAKEIMQDSAVRKRQHFALASLPDRQARSPCNASFLCFVPPQNPSSRSFTINPP